MSKKYGAKHLLRMFFMKCSRDSWRLVTVAALTGSIEWLTKHWLYSTLKISHYCCSSVSSALRDFFICWQEANVVLCKIYSLAVVS